MIPTSVLHLHLTCNVLIDKIENDKAEAKAAFVVLADDGIVELFGRYLDKLERCADGRWRFSERRDMCSFERRPNAFGI